MRNIIFIAYEFPPLKSAGVYRPVGFVNNLNFFGYNPIIVTLSQKSIKAAVLEAKLDVEYGKELFEKFTIVGVDTDLNNANIKTRWQNIKTLLFNPIGIEGKFWKNNFNSKIEEVINKYNPKLIYVTAPPFNILPIVNSAAKKHNLPLVIDLRDAWSNFFIAPYISFWHYFVNRNIEGKMLQAANKIVVTSKQTIQDFKKLHSTVDAKKFEYIPNGYNGVLNENFINTKPQHNITIGYFGSFYYNPNARNLMLQPWYKRKLTKLFNYAPNKQDWLYRSPYFFLKTIAYLKLNFPEYNSRIKITFVGENPNWLKQMIAEFDIKEQITLLPFMPHSKALELQKEMDLLLITSSKMIGGKDYSIAGKTFEYFEQLKPILSFVCDGAQKEILEESGLAIICNPDDFKSAAKLIVDYLDNKIVVTPNIPFIKKHSRTNTTKQLAEVFDCLI